MKVHHNVQSDIFLSLLLILFIALKLTGYIDWSWKWVLAPLWIPLAIGGVVLIIIGLLAMKGK